MKRMIFATLLCSLLLCGCGQNTEPAADMADVTTADSTDEELSEATEAEVKTNESNETEAESKTETTATDTAGTQAGVYSSESGVITLYADGTGTLSFQDTVSIQWNEKELIGEDFVYSYTVSGDTITVDVDGMKRSFTKGGEMPQSDVNPIMGFVGTYQSGRANMSVEALGDNSAKVSISWGGSAWTEGKWTMSGECNKQGYSIVIDYRDCTCKSVEYDDEGNIVSEETEYTNGTGTLTFSENTVKWEDSTENIDEVMLFEYIPENE